MIQIIPAIDIIGGECVRLSQGDYAQKTTYHSNPVEIAKQYEAIGLKRLHVVDLDGAKASQPQNLQVIEKIARETSLTIQFGGGIKTLASLERVLSAGVTYAICGSIAVTAPEEFAKWIEKYPDNIILGADVKGEMVAINGWKETSQISLNSIIERFSPKRVICTDISKDGMLEGPNFELYTRLQTTFPETEITVSGGISTFSDITRLNTENLRSVIVGKAIYENRITLDEIKKWLQNE